MIKIKRSLYKSTLFMLRKIFWMLSAMNVTFLVTTLHKTGERDGMKKEIEIE